MKKILLASFALIALAACTKTGETNIHCWSCTRDVSTDNNGTITRTRDTTEVCGLNDLDIENYERRNAGRKLLNVTYGDTKCTQKD